MNLSTCTELSLLHDNHHVGLPVGNGTGNDFASLLSSIKILTGSLPSAGALHIMLIKDFLLNVHRLTTTVHVHFVVGIIILSLG